MKLTINAEWNVEEIIKDYIIPNLEFNNIKFDSDNFKVIVHSDKQDKDIEVKTENIKFVYQKNN